MSHPLHSDACKCECELFENVIRAIHTPTSDGRSCAECSRIICLGTPNGLGSIQYPCLTITSLDGLIKWRQVSEVVRYLDDM
jgi:hypothetical protein